MSFMQPEVYKGSAYVVDTDCGISIVPVDVVGNIGSPDDEDFNRSALQDYCEGTIDEDTDIELSKGYLYRLSAPGYLDSTDWGIADTAAEAYTELLNMYGTDDGGEREDWELEAIELVIRDASPEKRQELAKWYGVEFDEESGVYEIQTEPDTDSGDYVLSPCGSLGGKIAVSQYGRCLGEFGDESEARHFIRRHMQAERYWPNVWIESDHGNYHLTTIVE